MTQSEMLRKVVMERAITWFRAYGAIDDKLGERLGGPDPATPRIQPNYLHERMAEAAEWMRSVGLAIRLIATKPRQKGCSTFSTAMMYHEANVRPIRATIIGGDHDQAENLFGKIGVYSQNDAFDWGTRRDVNSERAKFTHPNGRQSIIKTETAKNPEAGRSDTLQFLIATEPARWAEIGVADAAKVLAGLLKTVAPAPETCVIMESTARGPSGDFYHRWEGAFDFAEFKRRYEAGENMTGKYIRIFAPWFEFTDSRQKLSALQANQIGISIQANTQETRARYGDEKAIMERHGLDLEQMAWRRWAIEHECSWDLEQMSRDYPATAEEAFSSSSAKRFNAGQLDGMMIEAKSSNPRTGWIDLQSDGNVVFRVGPTDESWVWIWDEPFEGMRYLLVGDPATGASQTVSADPDAHGVFVLRAGYTDAHGRWWPPKTVARLQHGARWDIDILENEVWKLSRMYGGCMIVPEMNMDRGMVELLRSRGNAKIYQRQEFNKVEQRITGHLGWMTTPATRRDIIDGLARAIRERGNIGEGIAVMCPKAVDQLQNFIVKANGRAEAASGKHDDDVLSLAIGLETIRSATPYVIPRRKLHKPRDWNQWKPWRV